jgi:hypothetical protein
LFTGGRYSEVPKKYDNSFKATGHDKQQGAYADTFKGLEQMVTSSKLLYQKSLVNLHKLLKSYAKHLLLISWSDLFKMIDKNTNIYQKLLKVKLSDIFKLKNC